MRYDRGDDFPFDFEPNGIPFGLENRKENCHHDHILFNVKGNIKFSLLTVPEGKPEFCSLSDIQVKIQFPQCRPQTTLRCWRDKKAKSRIPSLFKAAQHSLVRPFDM